LFALPDIFDEVEEDLRAERARSFGRRFWGVGVGGALLILLGTGGYVAWQQRETASANAVADRFITAGKQADKSVTATGTPDMANAGPAGKTLADLAANGPAGYRVLARLRLAALQWQTGQHDDAVASWQAVADDNSAPTLLRDLAMVTSAEHQVDSGNPVLMRQQLEALTAPDNLWRPMAQQIIALLDIRTGKPREAAVILKRLSAEPLVPQEMRQMAGDLLTTLPAEALAPAPGPRSGPPNSTTIKTPAPAAPAPAAHG
jgi:hypothetical protein